MTTSADTVSAPADTAIAPIDAVDELLKGLTAAQTSTVRALRARRPVTIAQTQASYDALFVDVPADAAVSLADRTAIAVFTARLHGDEQAAQRYSSGDGVDARLTAVGEAAASAAVHGPYGRFPSAELAAFNEAGPTYRVPAGLVERVGVPLAAALEYAHAVVFHPRDAAPSWLTALTDAGWSASAIVTISQEIAFLSYQQRVAAGLAALAGSPLVHAEPVARRAHAVSDADETATPGASGTVAEASEASGRPTRFSTAQLDWAPWVPPVEESDLTGEQRDALVDPGRAKSPYFRLLARDPAILKSRTLADKDIFYNTVDGLPRAERELSAAATSRVNGCIFCASVHSRFAAHYSKRPDDVQRLLDEGVAGAQEPRWRALIDAAAALAQTPPAFTPAHADALRAAGLDDAEISDAIHAAAFFAWANRLMLGLGEPRVP